MHLIEGQTAKVLLRLAQQEFQDAQGTEKKNRRWPGRREKRGKEEGDEEGGETLYTFINVSTCMPVNLYKYISYQ